MVLTDEEFRRENIVGPLQRNALRDCFWDELGLVNLLLRHVVDYDIA